MFLWFSLSMAVIAAVILIVVLFRREIIRTNSSSISLKRNYRVFLLISIFIPLFTFFVYTKLGANYEWQLTEKLKQVQHSSEQTIDVLEYYLIEKPKNSPMWFLLGKNYAAKADYLNAERAFGQIVELQQQDAETLAQYAQAKYFNAQRIMTDEIINLVEQAIALDPDQPTALGLLGINAFETKDYVGAVDYWQRAIEQQPDGPATETLQKGIDIAKKRMGE